MTTTIIGHVPLAAAHDASCFGGKAANLARLLASGAAVPDGVALANEVLQHERMDLDALLPLLHDGPVIVRSSAIGEDSEEASFAGQLDSVAHVRNARELRDAIARVWASQRSERVLAYQRLREKPLAGMGIVVQRQVHAAVSGVLFTVSPTNPDEMLLEYCAGLGEALVSGAVNPGRVVLSRQVRDGQHAWSRIAEPDEPFAAEALLLNAGRMSAVAQLALHIERVFGRPQDIEWTIRADGTLWVVQSRPITADAGTTRREPNPRPTNYAQRPTNHAERPTVWSNANVNENFPDPISPLLYSIARVGYYHYFRNLGRAFGIGSRRLAAMDPALRQIIGVHGARMYYNLTSIHAVLRSAPFGELLAGSFNQFVGAGETTAPAVGAGYRWRQALELLLIAVKTAWQFAFVTRRVEAFERTVDAYGASTRPELLRDKAAAELLRNFRAFLDIRYHQWKNASLADAGSMICYGLLQRLLARAFPGRDQQALHNSLLKALPNLVSGVPPVKLWELSRMVREDADLRLLVENAPATEVVEHIDSNPQFRGFRSEFRTFLEDWGFRCSSELMLTVPSFQEEPHRVIELLRGYVGIDGESPADRVKRQAAERMAETRSVLQTLRRRSVVQWFATRMVLRWTQRSIQLRERARLKQALLYSRLRRVSLALGERLVAADRLARVDDIFFLTAEEVELLASGSEMFPDNVKALVAVRRQAHAEVSATAPPDSLELPAGEYWDHRSAGLQACDTGSPKGLRYDGGDSGACTGVGACGGTSTARAAILMDVTESQKLTPGDILVTRQTDPGWGPIFPLISGLVIERGGMLSHGAIIAREFGIPSVVGVKDATRRIPHGSRITVDGNRGAVYLGTGEA